MSGQYGSRPVAPCYWLLVAVEELNVILLLLFLWVISAKYLKCSTCRPPDSFQRSFNFWRRALWFNKEESEDFSSVQGSLTACDFCYVHNQIIKTLTHWAALKLNTQSLNILLWFKKTKPVLSISGYISPKTWCPQTGLPITQVGYLGRVNL